MFLSFMSLNFALVSDSGASCAEVSGSYLENHTKTQHLYAVWRHMKKCQSIKDHTADRRRTTEFSP